jgi:galactose oxidase-like protein/Kelch motif protein
VTARSAAMFPIFALAISFASCGGAMSSNPLSRAGNLPPDPPPTPRVSVIVTPAGIGQVWQGTHVQFSAEVIGTPNQSITWIVKEGSNGGTIDRTGLYTAPAAAGTFHVVATSQADATASGTASVQVPPLTVSISPASPTLRIGGKQLFSGFALAANQNVTWKLQEDSTAGSITPDGLYTAPSEPGIFHLIATAVFNTNVSSTAPITIVTTGFVQTSDMQTARSGHTATVLVDGRVLVAGGTTDVTHSAELFVPDSSFTGTTGGMIHLRSRHCAARLQDGRVLIAGGDDGSGTFFTTAEVFNPATQSFAATGDLNVARTSATATLLPNGKVLIAGGRDRGGKLLSSAEVYDPLTGRFTPSGDMHSPRAQHTATLLSNGKVLLIGNSNDSATAEVFDPTLGSFSTTGSLIQARSHHSATSLLDGNVLVLGGSHTVSPVGGGAPPAPVSIESAEIYETGTGVFRPAGKLLIARDSHSATLLANGTVLVAGGYAHDFDGDAQSEWYTISATELFNPDTRLSTAAAILGKDRAEHVATTLNNGEVLITGGISGLQELCCIPKPVSTPLSSAEIYK